MTELVLALLLNKETVYYLRKLTIPEKSEMRQDTTHRKTDTSRDQHVTFAGKKESVTFGDSNEEGEKKSGKHALTTGEGTPAAKTSPKTQSLRVSPEDTKQSDAVQPQGEENVRMTDTSHKKKKKKKKKGKGWKMQHQ